MNLSHISEGGKHLGDLLSIWVVLGTLAQILPSIAALLAIIWHLVRFYDRWQAKREGRKLDLDR